MLNSLVVAKALVRLRTSGGRGSGNFHHAGRPGHVGGSSSNILGAPRRAEPSAEEVKQVYEMHKQGVSHTAIATKMGWGGVSGSRHRIVKDVLEKYHEDGTKKAGGGTPPVEAPPVHTPPPPVHVAPPAVVETHGPVEVEREPKKVPLLKDVQKPQVVAGSHMNNPETRGYIPAFSQGHFSVHNADGYPIKVVVAQGVQVEHQHRLAAAIATVPNSFFTAAEAKVSGFPVEIHLQPEVIMKNPYGTVKQSNWKAAGLYNSAMNEIRVASTASGSIESTFFHELGHAIHAQGLSGGYGNPTLTRAYRADVQHQEEQMRTLPSYARDVFRTQMAKLAYYRANREEAFAENFAVRHDHEVGNLAIRNYHGKEESAFAVLFPNMHREVQRIHRDLRTPGKKKQVAAA